ncbi:MAG TPA: serine/threonine-protein kinase, partial [Planctomycetota bacterium]|nr:serine/threonine-protein kinase [Planctomycetota bacterium]
SAPRPVREQVRVLRDVAVAVQHAHDHDVLHRDLKPGNILVDPEGRPYVVDFGLARLEGDLALSGVGIVCGTASYMSPEQAEGRADVDHRCDVYALGVMLYEVLSGRTPFTGKDRGEILGKLRSDAVAPPGGFARSRAFSSVDAAVEKICLKALAKDRDKRTGTARALAAELTVWLDQSRERKAPAAPKPARRLPRWAWGAAAGGVAVLLLVAFLLRPRPAAPPDPDLKRARLAAEAGQAEAALAIYQSILERDPDNPHARQGVDVMRRHLVSEAAAEVDDALSALERVRSAGSNTAEAQARLDRARERLKKWTE